MAGFNDTQAFIFDHDVQSRFLIVNANGGSVVMAAYEPSSAEYVDVDTLNADGGYEVFTAGLRLRFTPSGGATYNIDTHNAREASA